MVQEENGKIGMRAKSRRDIEPAYQSWCLKIEPGQFVFSK
jgi:hypothetical protein